VVNNVRNEHISDKKNKLQSRALQIKISAQKVQKLI